MTSDGPHLITDCLLQRRISVWSLYSFKGYALEMVERQVSWKNTDDRLDRPDVTKREEQEDVGEEKKQRTCTWLWFQLVNHSSTGIIASLIQTIEIVDRLGGPTSTSIIINGKLLDRPYLAKELLRPHPVPRDRMQHSWRCVTNNTDMLSKQPQA